MLLGAPFAHLGEGGLREVDCGAVAGWVEEV